MFPLIILIIVILVASRDCLRGGGVDASLSGFGGQGCKRLAGDYGGWDFFSCRDSLRSDFCDRNLGNDVDSGCENGSLRLSLLNGCRLILDISFRGRESLRFMNCRNARFRFIDHGGFGRGEGDMDLLGFGDQFRHAGLVLIVIVAVAVVGKGGCDDAGGYKSQHGGLE